MELIQEQNPTLDYLFNDGSDSQQSPRLSPDGARPRLTLRQAIRLCWDKYTDFTGRARRSEYWWFAIAITVILLIPRLLLHYMPDVFDDSAQGYDVLWLIPEILLMLALGVGTLLLLLPSLAVTTRRLHDVGRSGWWIVGGVVASFISSIALAVGCDMAACDSLNEWEMLRAISHSSTTTFAIVLTLYLVHLAVSITLLVFTLLDSHRGENKYGPSPKYP